MGPAHSSPLLGAIPPHFFCARATIFNSKISPTSKISKQKACTMHKHSSIKNDSNPMRVLSRCPLEVQQHAPTSSGMTPFLGKQ